jgi:hypothetical protein
MMKNLLACVKAHPLFKSFIQLSSITALSAACAMPAQAQNICVFDIGGNNGDTFMLMRDYVLAAKKWNVSLTLSGYTNEEQAMEDFKNNKCQGIVATAFATRQLNNFTGSIAAIGAVPSNAIARNALALMSSPKLAGEMLEGDYEASGIIPLGLVYLANHDRKNDTLAKIGGNKIGVLPADPVQKRMASRVGLMPVSISYQSAGAMFAAKRFDLLPLPAVAFNAFEVYRSMGDKGGISRFAIAFITSNLIINKKEFPEGYGQSSRVWFNGQSSRLMTNINRVESAVPAKAWYDITNEEQVGYLRLLRQMRIEFVQNKTYNPKMLNLLKKLRCQQDPTSYECGLRDE